MYKDCVEMCQGSLAHVAYQNHLPVPELVAIAAAVLAIAAPQAD